MKTEVVPTDDDRRLFRAVCSCGWKSDPVDAFRVVLRWEDHVDGKLTEGPP